MHNSESKIRRQMEREAKRSKFSDVTGVGLCPCACGERRCECTEACAG